jgi:predicted amidohydrolase
MLLRMYAQNEPLTRDEFYPIAVSEMQKCAKEINSYVIFNLYEPNEKFKGFYYNTTVVINRNGEIAGKYRKVHTVDTESTKSKVVPGTEPFVLDTEFGKIGIATCFDIGFRPLWQKLAEKGAKAVIWTAAYDGGNLLDAYAITHMYWVISCVRTNHARIIDPLGREVAASARWDDLCIADIDLSMEIFHIDNQYQKINEIRSYYGDSVEIKTRSEENVFSISSTKVSMDEIKEKFNLVSYRDYHRQAEIIQKEWREKYNLEY